MSYPNWKPDFHSFQEYYNALKNRRSSSSDNGSMMLECGKDDVFYGDYVSGDSTMRPSKPLYTSSLSDASLDRKVPRVKRTLSAPTVPSFRKFSYPASDDPEGHPVNASLLKEIRETLQLYEDLDSTLLEEVSSAHESRAAHQNTSESNVNTVTITGPHFSSNDYDLSPLTPEGDDSLAKTPCQSLLSKSSTYLPMPPEDADDEIVEITPTDNEAGDVESGCQAFFTVEPLIEEIDDLSLNYRHDADISDTESDSYASSPISLPSRFLKSLRKRSYPQDIPIVTAEEFDSLEKAGEEYDPSKDNIIYRSGVTSPDQGIAVSKHRSYDIFPATSPSLKVRAQRSRPISADPLNNYFVVPKKKDSAFTRNLSNILRLNQKLSTEFCTDEDWRTSYTPSIEGDSESEDNSDASDIENNTANTLLFMQFEMQRRLSIIPADEAGKALRDDLPPL